MTAHPETEGAEPVQLDLQDYLAGAGGETAPENNAGGHADDDATNADAEPTSPKRGELGKPLITCVGGTQSENVRQAERALARATAREPEKGVYQRGGKLVRVARLVEQARAAGVEAPAGTLQIVEVGKDYLQYRLGDVARWERPSPANGMLIPADPPLQIARIICSGAFGSITPPLTGIVEAPVLRPDGTVLDRPGYDTATGLYFDPGDTVFPAIPERPSKQAAHDALKLLLEVLECPGVDAQGRPIVGFPFCDDGGVSKAVAVAAMMTPLVRNAAPNAPLIGFDATAPGTGKTELAYLPAYIAMGRGPKMVAHWQDQAEEKRRLMGVLLRGTPVNVIDNIVAPLESDALCLILTSPTFSERIVRTSDTPDVGTNVTLIVTGNALTIVGDLIRRTVLCRLDANTEFPEERQFEVDLHTAVPRRRGELAAAILTIVRAYIAAGSPPQNIPPFGSFEGWSQNVRAPLVWLGMADPCGDRGYLKDANPEGEDLAALLAAWWDKFETMELTAKQVIKMSDGKDRKSEALADALRAIDPKISSVSLGNFIRRFKGRIVNGLRFAKCVGARDGSAKWKVEKVE